ncbi:transmembrane channel-like protein 7 isoform X2 [Apostichopus japonicus]
MNIHDMSGNEDAAGPVYSNQPLSGKKSLRGTLRHAETAAKYQLEQVNDEEYDADQQIDNIIRNVPTSLQAKKELKSQYSKKQPSKFSRTVGTRWTKFKYRIYDLSLQFEIWRSSLKVVEGKFGTAVVSYFVFLKWLLFLNIYISFLVLGLIVLPQIILVRNYTAANETVSCEESYDDIIINDCKDGNGGVCIIDFLEGSGWMEQTYLFYGNYSPCYTREEFHGFDCTEIDNKYDLPLAYLLTTVGLFVLSFLLMLNYTSGALKESLASSEDTVVKYCNKVFCGWDYLLTDKNSATLKKESIRYELKSDLDEESRAMQRENRSLGQKVKLYGIRVILNIIVLSILGGAFFIIFYVTNFSIGNTTNPLSDNALVQLLISFLPSIMITVLNGIIPVVFNVMVKFEDYSPQFEIGITLLRTVFLRLASLVILIFSIFGQVNCSGSARDEECRFCTTSGLRCWETSVGQEFYKLALTDFAAVVIVVLAVEFPRKLAAKYFQIGIAKALGQMEFEIPKNVLAIVYSQAVCWIGVFFCPFLPLMTLVKFFVFFYLKKWSLLINMLPSQRPFRASRSGIFFMMILMITFLMCIAPVGYFIANIEPSRGCGPFRLQVNGNYIWNELQLSLKDWNNVFSDALQFVGSAGFSVPLIVFLALLLYYYVAIGSAQLGMIMLLKTQLSLEGKDKHFLLTRIDQLVQSDAVSENIFYSPK